MKPIDQAHNYDEIASHWDGSGFNRNNGIEQHKKALQFAKESGNAIDIGCGSSGRIIELLLSHGFLVEGLDYSVEMLNLAKKRHPQIVFHHADICEWNITGQYEFISAWDSIWHVPLAKQEMVLKKICSALAPGGVLIFTSGAVDEPGEVSNECFGQELYHAALGVPSLLNIMEESSCICRHLENDDWPSSHLYLVVQKKNA
jgi:SAM-dependent methyltransferase